MKLRDLISELRIFFEDHTPPHKRRGSPTIPLPHNWKPHTNVTPQHHSGMPNSHHPRTRSPTRKMAPHEK